MSGERKKIPLNGKNLYIYTWQYKANLPGRIYGNLHLGSCFHKRYILKYHFNCISAVDVISKIAVFYLNTQFSFSFTFFFVSFKAAS